MPQLSKGASWCLVMAGPFAFEFDQYRNFPTQSPADRGRERMEKRDQDSRFSQIDRVRSDWSAKVVALIPDTRPHQSDPRHWQSIEIRTLNHFIFFRSLARRDGRSEAGSEPGPASSARHHAARYLERSGAARRRGGGASLFRDGRPLVIKPV